MIKTSTSLWSRDFCFSKLFIFTMSVSMCSSCSWRRAVYLRLELKKWFKIHQKILISQNIGVESEEESVVWSGGSQGRVSNIFHGSIWASIHEIYLLLVEKKKYIKAPFETSMWGVRTRVLHLDRNAVVLVPSRFPLNQNLFKIVTELVSE